MQSHSEQKHEAALGILVGRRKAKSRPYHEQTTFFRRLIREGEAIGVRVFVFSPPGIHWKRRRMVGWTIVRGRWARRVYSFPDAVFDRVSPKQGYDIGAVFRVRRALKKRRVPLFNTSVGDKWSIHRYLSRFPHIRPYLPPTKILTTRTLAQMIGTYGQVYAKPAGGGQGKGVSWAARVRSNRYVYRTQTSRGSVGGGVRSIPALYSRLRRGRLTIVQRAIPTLQYENRPFDVRVLVQRGTDGEWRITGVAARVGAPKKKVTNMHAGGRARRLEEVLAAAGVEEQVINDKMNSVREIALDVVKLISDRSERLGELGIDLIIDRDLNIWFLEANSRTGRLALHRAGIETAHLGDRGPAEYALFLARQKG